MIAALRQRVADFLRERRIAALRERIIAAQRANDWPLAHSLAPALAAECLARSPEQVARMERANGLRPALKQTLVSAHCNGLLPAFAVRAAFRAFRLRGE